MSDDTTIDGTTAGDDATAGGGATPPPAKRRMRWWVRVLIGLGIVVLLLAGSAAALYWFGGMETPDPAMSAAYATMVAAGEAPAIEGRFTIPIPGCRCHSDDPALTMQHSVRRISECSECHERVGPPR